AVVVRAEVDPLPVVREARHDVFALFGRQAARFAALGVDDVNVGATFRARVEDDLPPVRRPARATHQRPIEGSELHAAPAIACTDPDFSTPGTIGDKNYLLTIR